MSTLKIVLFFIFITLFLLFIKMLKSKKTKQKTKSERKKLLKKMGDLYEKQIGLDFEKKGHLVIYNGFIKGYQDKGVDIIALSTKNVKLIQCKNWQKKAMTLKELEMIFNKLERYTLDFYDISHQEINQHLKIKKSNKEITSILDKTKSKKQTLQKTLYLSSEKVVDLEMGKAIVMIKENVFKYRDMQIVIQEIEA